MSTRAAERQLVEGKLRVLRAGAFSACAVSLAAVAHLLAGGTAPSPILLAGLGLLLAPVAVLSAGKLHRPAAVGTAMVAVQTALHWLFGQFGPAADCAQMSSHLSHPGMAHPGSLVCQDNPAMTMAGSSPLMVLAHLSAAALLGLLLSKGETALWRMLSWIFPKLPARFRPLPVRARLRRTASRRTAPLRPEPLTGAVGRRGPPRSPAIFA
ncbi:hypothetical protein [Kineosporia sp. NBRC 101731]|uniref:hypothetical protein n=1 Tax=Kineosporia sp. NBRC 101731 TaxID=3032199 RepID=UPI0024A5D09E|nr:hypothetical protein [Kineosporia sp. NBRC 101731]GLY27286.1 hypothetical protein Kisp02_06510 [Kineosporia sp. NBRC 101731]